LVDSVYVLIDFGE